MCVNRIGMESMARLLIVDDVLTTGRSMEDARRANSAYRHMDDVIGAVIFARAKPAPWIKPVFQMVP